MKFLAGLALAISLVAASPIPEPEIADFDLTARADGRLYGESNGRPAKQYTNINVQNAYSAAAALLVYPPDTVTAANRRKYTRWKSFHSIGDADMPRTETYPAPLSQQGFGWQPERHSSKRPMHYPGSP